MGKETKGASASTSRVGVGVRWAALSTGLAACGIAGLNLTGEGSSPDRPADTMSSVSSGGKRTMLTAEVVAWAPDHREWDLAPALVLEQPARPAVEPGDVGEEARGESLPESGGQGEATEELPDQDDPTGAREPKQPAKPHATAPLPRVARSGLGSHPVARRQGTSRRSPGEEAPGFARSRSAPLNVETRALAASIALGEIRRLHGLEQLGAPGESDGLDHGQPVQIPGNPGCGIEPRGPATDESDSTPGPLSSGSDSLDVAGRRLLFVWDSSIVLDAQRSEELLVFASRHGFDSLAVEATGVGYRDAALTSAFTSFVSEARGHGLETLALVGYPWFAVSADAGLPGQPTSSQEGLDILEVIRDTGLFDGVVDDSHSYGVTYEVNGEQRNYLFDEPEAASLDMQAWLRDAKGVLGGLPLIKTTPFWFDSHPDLGSVVDLEGQRHVSLGHLVANEVDATVVLAYRDELLGPGGVLELVAGELAMGPAIIALETGDLGPALEYLTFHEEGLLPLKSAMDGIDAALGGQWSFAGLAVHYYSPLKGAASDLSAVQSFGFVGQDSVTVQYGALIDAYDSSLGRYYDQISFQPAIGMVAGFGSGAVVSNGPISLSSGALIFGDARAGVGETVNQANGVTLTGEAISLSDPAPVPDVAAIDRDSNSKVRVGWNQTDVLTGDQSLKEIRLNGYAMLDIKGPAHVVVDKLSLSDYAYIFADVTNGPVKITVNEQLHLGVAAWIAPTSLQARDLTMDFAGGKSITMKREARLLTDLTAPRARVVVGQDAEIYGRARAREIRVENAGQLHLDVDLLR